MNGSKKSLRERGMSAPKKRTLSQIYQRLQGKNSGSRGELFSSCGELETLKCSHTNAYRGAKNKWTIIEMIIGP